MIKIKNNKTIILFIIICLFIILLLSYAKILNKEDYINNNNNLDNNINLIIKSNNNNSYIIQKCYDCSCFFLSQKYYLNKENKDIKLDLGENKNKEIDIQLYIQHKNIENQNQNQNIFLSRIFNYNLSNNKYPNFTNITFYAPRDYMIILNNNYSPYKNNKLWINNNMNQDNVFYGLKNNNLTLNIHNLNDIILSLKLVKIHNYNIINT